MSKLTLLTKAHTIRALSLIFAILLCAVSAAAFSRESRQALRFVHRLGAGINLGNSLDVYRLKERKPNASIEEYLTYWGNPPITPELLHEIRQRGFSTVRIPVSWSEHMSDSGLVDAEWMAYVTSVVDAALAEELYVILDIHHEPWLVPTAAAEAETAKTLTILWRQIAESFADYDERLLFEAMNEPRLENSEIEWTSGSSSSREVVNRLNAAFVKTVRACGGGNSQRWLLLPAYCSSHRESALSALQLPEDSRIIVAVHAYLPYNFTLNEQGTSHWSADSRDDIKEIDRLMERLHRLFIKKNIPVVITEFGCNEKGDRLAWARYYTQAAKQNGIPLIWWDEGKSKQLIDRQSCGWTQPELVDILIENAL